MYVLTSLVILLLFVSMVIYFFFIKSIITHNIYDVIASYVYMAYFVH